MLQNTLLTEQKLLFHKRSLYKHATLQTAGLLLLRVCKPKVSELHKQILENKSVMFTQTTQVTSSDDRAQNSHQMLVFT